MSTTTRSDFVGLRPNGLPLFAAIASLTLGSPSLAGGGDPDFFILGSPRVIQTIETSSIPFIAGKPAFARIAFRTLEPAPPGTEVDALMRVFVDGVETAESPIFSDNGPIVPTATPNPFNENDTLNFVFIPAESDNVLLTFELNPSGPGQVPESNLDNNSTQLGPLDFQGAGRPEIVYVPIDYRLNGELSPNLPDPNLIDPGVGDNFSQAIFPTRFAEYRRSDFPSKLWTSNVDSAFGSGGAELNASLAADLALMNPQPDFIYGWIPGPLPSINGQANGIPGISAFGNTDPVRHQRTFSHELGHLYGLAHNNTQSGALGIDVERHLNITQSLPLFKPTNMNDIMVAGLTTDQAWVATGTSNAFTNHPSFAQESSLSEAQPGHSLLVSGLWHHQEREFHLLDMFELSGSRATRTFAPADSDLLLKLYADGELLSESGVIAGAITDCSEAASSNNDSESGPNPYGAFVAVIPVAHANAVDRLVVVDATTGTTVLSSKRSASAPKVAFASSSTAIIDGIANVTWNAVDADGDAMTFALRYSPDGETMIPLGTGLRVTSMEVDLSRLPALRSGVGFFELIASDGLHTARIRTAGLTPATAAAGGNTPPTTHVYTPDSGFTYLLGGTVILRSSGWDLEDRSLTGDSIQWSSDLDGPIGSGRVTSVASLSVGTHLITVTATDSDGLTAFDTTTVTIADRLLPDVDGSDCQANIGFGGPGTGLLQACGGDLSSGTTVDISLTGAVANTPVFFGVSTASNPTPFLGGTVVTVPQIVLIGDVTDGAGQWLLPGIEGGGGPFSFYIQTVYVDGNQTEGLGFSNAVRLDYLP